MLTFPLWGSKFFDSAPTAESCSSGGSCSASVKQVKTEEKVDRNALPVLKYMSDEKDHPTKCNQKACTGTGRTELDALLAAQSMKRLGYKNVYNLTAGVVGWARAGYPFADGEEKVTKTEDEV